MPIFNQKERRPFYPLTRLTGSDGREVWTGDLVRIKTPDGKPRGEATFGVELSGYWETALFLGIATPNHPEVSRAIAIRPDRDIIPSDPSILVMGFYVDKKGVLFFSRPALRTLKIELVRDNQGTLIYCSEAETVLLFPFETDDNSPDILQRTQGLGGAFRLLNDFNQSVKILNPYYLPLGLATDDPTFYEARVRDLSILHKDVRERRKKTSTPKEPTKYILHTFIGDEKGRREPGPYFEAPTLEEAKEAVEEFVELFDIFLTVYKLEKK